MFPFTYTNHRTIYLLPQHTDYHQNSIYSQIVWAIYELGLDTLFHIPKTYSNPIVYLPTGQRIFFMGMDRPEKVKSIKTARGYIGITWFNNRTK